MKIKEQFWKMQNQEIIMPKHTINISLLDEKILKHKITDLDQWFARLIAIEIARCKEIMVRKAIIANRLDPSIKTMSADDDTLLGEVFSAKGYQDAKKRHEAVE